MKIFGIMCLFITVFSADILAASFEIRQEGKVSIAFDSVDIAPDSIEEQNFCIDTRKSGEGIIAFLKTDSIPNDTKRQLPFERYINPSRFIRYDVVYSPSNKTFCVVQRLENRSAGETWTMDAVSFTLKWYLIK